MIKNKRLIILGSVMLTVPLIASVSCSTTWTKWNVESDPDASKNKIEYVSKIAPDNLWKVREIDVIKTAAWNQTTSTIDLAQLNNQFELMDLIINILNIKSIDPIDTYWDVAHYDEMKNYLDGITKDVTMKIKFGTGTPVRITWNVGSIIDAAIKGIDDYIANPDDDLKAYNVELHGLNSDGQPIDFDEVANVGVPLTSNPVVSALLAEDNAFALSLSKLVNLPKESFDAFNDFLTKINELLTSVFTCSQFTNWSTIKSIDFTVSPQTGMIGAYRIDYSFERLSHLKGIFMIRMLKSE